VRVCVFPREMVVKNRTSVFTLAIGERGQCEKKAKKRESSLYERIADFCGHLAYEHLFLLYACACISFRSLFVTTRCCVCVCVCQGNIDL